MSGRRPDVRVCMELKPLIDSVAPTPFGWVITTQDNFDLNSMLAFRSQLLSLSRAFGPSTTPRTEVAATAGELVLSTPLRAA